MGNHNSSKGSFLENAIKQMKNSSDNKLELIESDLNSKRLEQLLSLLINREAFEKTNDRVIGNGYEPDLALVLHKCTNVTVEAVNLMTVSLLENDAINIINLFELSECNLSDIAIGVVALNLLSKSDKVVELSFENNYCTQVGSEIIGKSLTSNKHLKILNLNKNKLSDAGLMQLVNFLYENDTLEDLYLNENEIKDQGIISLANLMKKNKSIKTLLLADNQITDNGAAALANSILINPLIETIDLYGNDLTSVGTGLAQLAMDYPERSIDCQITWEDLIKED